MGSYRQMKKREASVNRRSKKTTKADVIGRYSSAGYNDGVSAYPAWIVVHQDARDLRCEEESRSAYRDSYIKGYEEFGRFVKVRS